PYGRSAHGPLRRRQGRAQGGAGRLGAPRKPLAGRHPRVLPHRSGGRDAARCHDAPRSQPAAAGARNHAHGAGRCTPGRHAPVPEPRDAAEGQVHG
nr:hypothetical protein [Tanacetum cinerariifolium]